MNYFGSKSRQAKYIVPIIQKYIDDNGISMYLEPFVGGANIIDKIVCDIKIGTDINKYIIALFQYIQNGGHCMFVDEEFGKMLLNTYALPYEIYEEYVKRITRCK